MPVQTIPELFLAAVHSHPRPDLFSYRDASGKFVDVSSQEALEKVREKLIVNVSVSDVAGLMVSLHTYPPEIER